MNYPVLVAYATKYGATAEIAERIGAVLRETGFTTDVLSVKQVSDLTPYRAVILGSAVYLGSWRKEGVRFLEANEQVLAERDVWLFSSGPTGQGDPLELMQGWRFPPALQSVIDRIQPHDIAFFHGDLEMDRLNFIEKAMIKNLKAPVGDFRDWDAITAWALTVAEALKEPVA